MKKETLRSVGCITAAMISLAIHHKEPERAIVSVVIFCLITIGFDVFGTRNRPPA